MKLKQYLREIYTIKSLYQILNATELYTEKLLKLNILFQVHFITIKEESPPLKDLSFYLKKLKEKKENIKQKLIGIK